MGLFSNARTSTYGFFFANIVLVFIMFHRIDDPLQFFFMGGGLVVFSYFLKRAIDQAVGV